MDNMRRGTISKACKAIHMDMDRMVYNSRCTDIARRCSKYTRGVEGEGYVFDAIDQWQNSTNLVAEVMLHMFDLSSDKIQ